MEGVLKLGGRQEHIPLILDNADHWRIKELSLETTVSVIDCCSCYILSVGLMPRSWREHGC